MRPSSHRELYVMNKTYLCQGQTLVNTCLQPMATLGRTATRQGILPNLQS